MGFRKCVREELRNQREVLEELKRMLEGELSRTKQLEDFNARLMDERRELLNRIMAVNYEKFQIYQTADQFGSPPAGLSLDQLEEMAGESFSMDSNDEES